MTDNQIAGVLQEVSYKDWTIEYHGGDDPYLQVCFLATDSVTGVKELQRGRKWRLSSYMTRSELVQTAFLACLTAEEHEVRETFRYKGQTVYGPHFDVEKLVELCLAEASREVRE